MARHYSGTYRTNWTEVLAFAICIPLFAYGCYAVFNDAAYHEMVTTGRRRLLDFAPRPLVQGLFVLCLFAACAYPLIKMPAVFRKSPSFDIGREGVRTWQLLRKSRFMAWDRMQSAQMAQKTLIIKGVCDDRKGTWIGLDLTGHDREEVFDAIASYRPDLIEQLG